MRRKNIELMKKIKAFVESYYSTEYHSPSIAEIAKNVGVVKSTVYKYLLEMREKGMIQYDGKEIRTDLIDKIKPNVTRAAILGGVSCGVPKLAEENIEEYVSLPESLFGKGEFYILRAKGDSMIEVGIDDGDLVVIKAQNYARNGEIVVALIDDEATLKRFYKEEKINKVRLHPENSKMEDIIVDNCIIQGIAVKVIKDLI